MKKFIFILAALASFPATAAEQCVVDVKVNGLVCDFCAQALEKTIGEQPQVQAIEVDLDNSVVHITYRQGQSLDEAAVTQLITDAGYAVQQIDKGC
jgi:copper chaperone CopZ